MLFAKPQQKLLACVSVISIVVCAGPHEIAQTAPITTSASDVIRAIRFSPDSHTLAIARGSREDNRVELWDTDKGTIRHTIRGFDGPIWSISFSPDGRILVTGSSGFQPERIANKPHSANGRTFSELKWWSSATGDLIRRVEVPGDDHFSVTAYHSPDGRTLATSENRTAFVTYFQSTFDDRIGFRPQLRGQSEIASDLKLLNATTGDEILSLKEGFNAFFVPMFGRGSSQSDFFLTTLANQMRQTLVFSPDGRIVCAWNNSEIRLWNSLTGEELSKLKNFKGRLSAVAFSTDGQSLVGAIVKLSVKNREAQYRSELRLWDVANGAAKQVLPIRTEAVSCLVPALNGQQWLVSGTQREDEHSFATLELVDRQSGSLGKLIAKSEGSISSVALAPNGTMVAFQTDASVVNLVNTQDWKIKYTFDSTAEGSSKSASRFLLSVNKVVAVAFSSSGSGVVGAIDQGGTRVWDARTGEVKQKFAEERQPTTLADISLNGRVIARVNEDSALSLLDVQSGTSAMLANPNADKSAVAVSVDGAVIAVAYRDHIELISTSTRELLRTLSVPGNQIQRIAFSNDGQSIVSGDADGTVSVMSVSNGKALATLHTSSRVTAIRFGPSGETLAAGTADGTVLVWNWQSGSQLLSTRKHTGNINAIAFSPDESLLASGSDDRTVIIWDVSRGNSRKTLKGHEVSVTSLAFSPDSTVLAVGTGNASVVLWDIPSGKLNRVLR